MTRTGTLAFSHSAVLAMLLGWTGFAQAQNLVQHSQWQPAGEADRAPTFRRADSTTETWQPTRTAVMPTYEERVRTAAPPRKTWLTPTQAAGRKKATQQAADTNSVPKTASRAPNPFVPPTEAEELTAAPKPAPKRATNPYATAHDERPAQTAAAQPRQRANASHSAAVVSQAPVSQSAARTNRTPATRDYVAKQQQRVTRAPNSPANRPRSSASANRWLDDTWIRPLKQVAYQAGEPEELYAPPGDASEMQMQGEPMGPGPELQSDGEWIGSPDGVPYGSSCCDGDCGPGCGDDLGCCSTCGRELEPCHIDLAPGLHDAEACQEVRFRIPRVNTLMVDAGVHGFKGPYDQSRDTGNFGFQEGFNLGFKFPLTDFGYQVGYQAMQSQLSGDANAGITTSFSQSFFTAGLFRRTRDGFQGGVAWDLMLDDRNTNAAFSQIRAELGFVDCGCHEVGATIAVHLRDHTIFEVDNEQTIFRTFQSADQYLLYYRMHGARGGEGRVYGGLTDDADGIIGSDFLLPLTDSWSLQPAFTYLLPWGNGNQVASREEAWNIGINLVWHWKGQARECHSSPYRPLFNVADNGTMIIDNRP
jgi:Family of unknown function (DUF6666)